ncbi:MAG: thioredoxin [Phycisphaerae bacterium]|nr:thioredoxin [Phycisphaerae bacterium]
MASEFVIEFTDGNFQSEVLGADVPVLVDFWAPWCGPCKMLGPVIDELAKDFHGKAKIGKVNTDENQDTAMKFGIQSIPTVLLFKGGQLTRKFVGLTSKVDLKAAINEQL